MNDSTKAQVRDVGIQQSGDIGQAARSNFGTRSRPAAQDPPRSRNLRDEEEAFMNDSTQAQGTDVGIQQLMVVGETEEAPPIKKRGGGPARGTEFERLRKMGKIPLVIQDGHRGPSCENSSIFNSRMTSIVKVHAELRHERWGSVTNEEKQELIVRADFVLDWTKENHREMVCTYLADKYNAYHYELHKVYLKYISHEEAFDGGASMVDSSVWKWLCERWASGTFKEQSRRATANRKKLKVKHTGGRKSFVRILEEKRETAPNLVVFYKETHWSKQKDKFINATTEHNYNLMLEQLHEKDPEEENIVEAAEVVFKDILGYRSGYAQGLGHSVIPDPSPSMQKNKAFKRLYEENERNKSSADMYKEKLEQIMGNLEAMQHNFSEYEKTMNFQVSELEGNSESHRETQRDA